MLRPYTAARRAATACPLERVGVFAGWPERPCWGVGSRRTEIGRGAWRGKGEISGGAVSLKKKKRKESGGGLDVKVNQVKKETKSRGEEKRESGERNCVKNRKNGDAEKKKGLQVEARGGSGG